MSKAKDIAELTPLISEIVAATIKQVLPATVEAIQKLAPGLASPKTADPPKTPLVELIEKILGEKVPHDMSLNSMEVLKQPYW